MSTDPIKNQKTAPKTPTPTGPSAAEAKKAAEAEAAAAKAKFEEGAEDIGGLMPDVAATSSDRSDAAYRTVVANLDNVLVTTDDDVSKALSAMEGLSPGETRATLEALKKGGVFDKLIAESDGNNRSRLVDLMMKGGMIAGETQAAGTAGPKGPLPPAPPTLARNDAALPDNVNAMLRDENVARGAAYKEEFIAYRDTYRQAVRDAPSFMALRQLGEITEPALPLWEPGTEGRNDDHEWSAIASREPDVRTGSIVTNKLYELNGLSPPGTDVNLSGSIKATLTTPIGGASAELSATYSEKRDGSSSSSRSGSASVTVGAKSGPNVKASASTKETRGFDGKVVVETKGGVTASLGRDVKRTDESKGRTGADVGASSDSMTLGLKDEGKGGSLTIRKDAEGKVASGTLVVDDGRGAVATVDVGGTGLKAVVQAEGATLGVEATTERATLTVGADGIAVTGGVDKNGAIIVGGSVTESVGVSGNNIEVTLSGEATIQLPSREDYVRFVAIVEAGPFDPPPELERGVRWGNLSEGARKAYELYGWSAASWDRNAGDKQKIKTAMMGVR